ncbi:hypothetical protein HanIR_Chr07g0306251 [Helianthus annuus]|nr:hypothetical protein HanIR_Chr07g0306251 [Helianthus annuus]
MNLASLSFICTLSSLKTSATRNIFLSSSISIFNLLISDLLEANSPASSSHTFSIASLSFFSPHTSFASFLFKNSIFLRAFRSYSSCALSSMICALAVSSSESINGLMNVRSQKDAVIFRVETGR